MSVAQKDEKTVAFIEESGKLIGTLMKQAETNAATMTKIAEQAPSLAQRLVQMGLVTKELEKKAVEMLCNPLDTLTILGNVLNVMRNEREKAASVKTASIGTAEPAPGQAGGVSSLNDSYVGRKSASYMKESDRINLARFNLLPGGANS